MPDPIRAGGNDPFKPLMVTEEAAAKIGELSAKASNLYEEVLGRVKPSRERSLALTKMEEANFWLNRAILAEQG